MCDFACSPEFGFCPKCGAGLDGATSASAVETLSADARGVALRERIPPALAERAARAEQLAVAEGERRPVTILFADLSGFTALSERLDPEDLSAIIDRCLGAMADVIYRYEGTVDKYIGDCVMALFGAPIAHEDDPERALRAALDLRDTIAEINGELFGAGASDVPTLSLHIGVNTGIVVAGGIGSERRRDYTVLGDAVNVASRLASAAQGEEVVVGDATRRLAQHAFELESMGLVELKGKAEPLPSYRLVRPRAQPLPARGLDAHGLRTPYVGRADELAQLTGAFERLARGRAEVVSVVGEAGTGKSRLIREALKRLDQSGDLARLGVAVRQATCSPLGEHTYGVMTALLRNAYDVADDDSVDVAEGKLRSGLGALGAGDEELDQLAPLLARLLGFAADSTPLRNLDPERVKRQVFHAVGRALSLRLRHGPVALIAEDVHWADAASIELLSFLLDRFADQPLLFVLVFRPSFAGSALFEVAPSSTEIRLTRMAPGDMRALLEAMVDGAGARLPERALDLIVERADGNPYHLEELVRDLLERGLLDDAAGSLAVDQTLDELEVPSTLRGLLLARLDRLDAAVHRAAQEASVLGPVFSERLFRAVTNNPERVRADLDALEAADVVEATIGAGSQVDGQQFRFASALLQNVAYQTMLQRRRADLHELVALRLEAAPNPSARLDDILMLAHHFSASPTPARAARHYRAAGDWVRAIFANDDAAHYYGRALAVLPEGGPESVQRERLELRELLGDVLGLAGLRVRAEEHYQAALSGYEALADLPTQARVLRALGGLLWNGGERAAALERYQRAMALLDGREDDVELIHVYQEMGRLAFRSGDARSAIEWSRRALAQAGQDADGENVVPAPVAAAVAQALNTLGIALARMGEMEAAVQQVERGLALAQEHDLHRVAARAFANLGVMYATLNPSRAIDVSVAGLDLAKKIGDLSLQPWLYANLAGAYCTFTGQCEEEGIDAAQRAIDLDRQLEQLDHLAVPLIVLGQIKQCHGWPDQAKAHYEEALSLAEKMGEPQLIFPCYDGLATLYLDAGDVAQAETFMRKGIELCEGAGLDPDALLVLPFLS